MIGYIILNNYDYQKQVDNLNSFFTEINDEKIIIKENEELIDCDIYVLCDCSDARNYITINGNKLDKEYYTNVYNITKNGGEYIARRMIYSAHRIVEFNLGQKCFVTVATPSIENKKEVESWQEKIENASILYAVGNGCGLDDINRIMNLANKTGAVVGCTRKVVGSGKMPHDSLIGSSGSKSSAKLCITFGVSGAGAFLTGIDKCKKIIAINTDENALILRNCDIAIIDKIENIIYAMETCYGI